MVTGKRAINHSIFPQQFWNEILPVDVSIFYKASQIVVCWSTSPTYKQIYNFPFFLSAYNDICAILNNYFVGSVFGGLIIYIDNIYINKQ